MRSDRPLALLASLFLACSGSVHDASVASAPLLVVQGHVDVSALQRSNPDAALIGTIFWAGPAWVNPVCLQFDRPEIRAACPDPYGVFIAGRVPAAPVQADGSFAVALDGLPSAYFSVGDASARITYGTLVVVEDVDGDGHAFPFGRKSLDTVVAAAFYTLRAPQVRIVLREGGFAEGSFYYPAPGCPPPPSGFSMVAVPPYSDVQPPPGGCVTRDIGDLVEVAPVAPEQGRAFACRESPIPLDSEFTQRATSITPRIPDPTPVCLSPQLVVFIAASPARPCPMLLTFALKGCASDPLCEEPEWDDTARVPEWWPCR